MASGDFSYFTPAESQYSKPGAADERARQEAIKKATYLSSMDQFYANLAETTREFNKTYGLQVRAAELAEKEQSEASAYRTTSLAQTKELAEKGYGLQETALRQQYQLGLLQTGAGLYKSKLEYQAALKTKGGSGGSRGGGYESSGYLSPFQYEEDKMREAVLKGAS